MTGYSYQPQTEFNIKDGQRQDSRHRYTSRPMPDLPEPFEQKDDCHWLLWHNEVNVALWYDRLNGLWNVRFDWPDIPEMKFDRDTPAMEMREQIIKAIDNKWQNELDEIPF